MAKPKRIGQKGAVELLEEVIHLLRVAPIGVLTSYYLGTLPFILGFLFFWADMSRGAYAYSYIPEASLAMAMLFFWMKCWQAVYCSQLLAQLQGTQSQGWTFRRVWRMLLVQMKWQPSGLFILPIALLIAFPFAWFYAFYQNISVFGDGTEDQVYKKAKQQSLLWSGQNHIMLSIMGLFAFFVFLNLVIVAIVVPSLLKSFFDIDTTFTRTIWSVFNTTFWAVMFFVTFLCVDPLVKAFYVLRCFYGEARKTGVDLRAQLKKYTPSAKTSVAMLLLSLSLASPTPVVAQEPEDSGFIYDLDRSIGEVIQQRKYTWRMPRGEVPEQEKGWLASFFDSFFSWLDGWRATISRWLKKLWEWLDWFSPKPNFDPGGVPSGSGWQSSIRFLGWILIALLVIGIGIVVWHGWRKYQRGQTNVVASTPVVATKVNLEEEDIAVDQLPEDGWQKLALELIEKGELRLALRAFYLAILARLAHEELIALARFKSNREYQRELDRHSYRYPDMAAAFAQNLLVFERAWYGVHEVTNEVISGFRQNMERIRVSVEN